MIVKEVSKYEPAHFFFWLFIGQDLLTVCNMQSALAGGHRCAAQRPDCAPSGHPLGGRSGHREMAPGSRFPIL